MKNNALRPLLLTTLALLASLFPYSPTNAMDSAETHPWGTSLADFRSSRGSKTTFSVDRLNARVLDYLLMDFHEVPKDDPARAPKCSAQTIAGDPALYIFYRGKFCAVSRPLPLDVYSPMVKDLRSKSPSLSQNHCRVVGDYRGEYGSENLFFNISGFTSGDGSLFFLVKVTGYYEAPDFYGNKAYGLVEAGQGDPLAVFQIEVSPDYFKGDNAYKDLLENRKNPAPGALNFLQKLSQSIEH